MADPHKNTQRLFLAFELPGFAKERLGQVIEDIKVSCKSANISTHAIKLVNPQVVHLTTQFLGDIETSNIPKIRDAVSEIHEQAELRAFALQSRRIGGFPNLNRPRVIWADLAGADLARMQTVTELITQQLIEIDSPLDAKPFRPHLTLGRVRREAKIGSLEAVADAVKSPPIDIVFEKLTLFSSELTSKGPIHSGLASWDFPAEETFG